MIADGQYLSLVELKAVQALIERLNMQRSAFDEVSMAVQLFDSNGESLGYVGYTDSEYAYYPTGVSE